MANLYKKVAGAWVLQNTLQGPQGPQGSLGAASTQTSRATAFTLNSPSNTALHTGSFTAASDKHRLDIDISHDIFETGSTAAVWTLFVGPSTTSPITPAHQYDSLGTGVQKFRVGTATGRRVHIEGKILITGLTTGTVYNWELSAANVGGQVVLPQAGPFAVACAPNITPFPEAANVVVTRSSSDGKLHLVKVQGFQEPAGMTETSSTTLTGGSSAGRVALTPDGTKAVSVHTTGGNVAVVATNVSTKAAASGAFTLGTWTLGAPTYYTPPGTTPAPGGLAINAAGTTAYMTISYGAGNQSSLYSMVIATGVFTKVTDIGINAGAGDVVLTPDGLYALVGRSNSLGVVKVRLSDGVTMATSTAATMPTITVEPTGTYCYTAAGSTLYKLNVSDLTTALSAATVQGTSASVQRLAVHNDGRSFWAAVQTASSRLQIQQFLTADLGLYVNIPAHPVVTTEAFGSDIAIGPYAALMIPAFWDGTTAANGALVYFPNGEFQYNPVETQVAGDYYGHDIRVLSTKLT